MAKLKDKLKDKPMDKLKDKLKDKLMAKEEPLLNLKAIAEIKESKVVWAIYKNSANNRTNKWSCLNIHLTHNRWNPTVVIQGQ